ncbi:hypothetical protein D3C87_1604870 [compost metagenome]
MTPSSMSWTPLFLNAEPQVAGTMRLAMVPLRRPSMISSSLSSPVSRYLLSSSSSPSAAASTICPRYMVHSSSKSAGTSTSWMSVPMSLVYMKAFIFTRSTMPLKLSSAPIGYWMGTTFALRRSFIMSMTRKKSAPMRSILLTNARRGTL